MKSKKQIERARDLIEDVVIQGNKADLQPTARSRALVELAVLRWVLDKSENTEFEMDMDYFEELAVEKGLSHLPFPAEAR